MAVVALVVFAVPSLANAASTATIPTRQLTAKGGKVTMSVTVKSPGWCVWSSSPKVPKFNLSQRCNAGKVTRSAMIGPNLSAKGKDYTLSLKLVAKSPVVDDLKVVEAEQIPPTTTTTSTTVPPTTTSTTTTTTLPPVSLPSQTSPNWSGYVLTGASGGYRAISADWTVPTVDCTSVPDGTTADWVGVNGWNGVPGLFQDGTTSQCVNGQQNDFAWWTDTAEKYSAPSLFAVAPGDVISAEVWQQSSDLWAYDVSDLTSGSWSSASESFSGPGTTAEWIAEDPEDPEDLTTEELQPLADFGSVTFTDLGLTVPSSSWTVPPYSDAVKMATDGWVEALPRPIQGSGTSAAFTVTYETPGELSSTAGSALMSHAQSTFVATVARIAPQRRAGRPRSRSVPALKLGLARIKERLEIQR
jgi:hypothetical protein